MVALEFAEKAHSAGIDHNASASASAMTSEPEFVELEPEPEFALRLAPMGE
jgi:hypothetical protein